MKSDITPRALQRRGGNEVEIFPLTLLLSVGLSDPVNCAFEKSLENDTTSICRRRKGEILHGH